MAKRFHKIRFNEQSLEHEEVPFALRDYVLYFAGRTIVGGGIAAASIGRPEDARATPLERTTAGARAPMQLITVRMIMSDGVLRVARRDRRASMTSLPVVLFLILVPKRAAPSHQ